MNNIGIVGGMGPLAGTELHRKIIEHTLADIDQDHIPVYHISCSHLISDRTTYYFDRTLTNPAIEIVNIISQLFDMNCNVIGIPCGSAHLPCIRDVIDELIQKSYDGQIKIVHLIEEVKNYLVELGFDYVGILATKGVITSKLYDHILEREGIRVYSQSEQHIDKVHDCIYNKEYGIKSNGFIKNTDVQNMLVEEVRYQQKNGVQCIIMGCTEIPLALTQNMADIPLINILDVLGKALIRYSNIHKLSQ